MIFRLVLKDFKIIQNNIVFFLAGYMFLFSILLGFLFMKDPENIATVLKSFTTTLWFFIFFIGVIFLIRYENKNGFEKIAISLPISRKKYVYSNYLFIFIFSIISFLISLLINYLLLKVFILFKSVELDTYNTFFGERNLGYYLTLLVSIPIGTIVGYFFYFAGGNKLKIGWILIGSYYSMPLGIEYLENKVLGVDILEKLNRVVIYEATVHNFIYWIVYIVILIVILFLSKRFCLKKDY